MAYADQEMSGNRIAAFILVALLHVALGYALVTGLAYEGFKAVVKKVTAVDIKKEEEKKEEKPPPPKKEAAPPPIVAPPPIININAKPPPVEVVDKAPPVTPVDIPRPAPTGEPAPPPPPPPPPPKGPTTPAKPKGDPSRWVTNDDYPTRAAREERQGTTGFRLTVGPDGRATSCDITSSSGSPDLDNTACSLLMKRARFTPAMKDGEPTTGSWGSRFRWVLQDE